MPHGNLKSAIDNTRKFLEDPNFRTRLASLNKSNPLTTEATLRIAPGENKLKIRKQKMQKKPQLSEEDIKRLIQEDIRNQLDRDLQSFLPPDHFTNPMNVARQ